MLALSRRDHLQTEELFIKTAVGSFLDSFTHGRGHYRPGEEGHDLNYVVMGLIRAATPHVNSSTVIDETPATLPALSVNHGHTAKRR